MRVYRFLICDVFTETRFGGNQLAVLPDAEGLSTEEMQQIAREFNYSESAFVFAGSGDFTRKVRIFTPSTEVPFAGHPNVGTAFVLASIGELGELGNTGDGLSVVFDEAAGAVRIEIREDDEGRIRCELEAPQSLQIGEELDTAMIARALSLDESDIVTDVHAPRVASVGLPFVMVELASLEALQRARAFTPGLEEIQALGIVPDLHLYFRSDDEFDIRARMFAPFDGVPEDPATGSANCGLVALLTDSDARYADGGEWRIAQGVEMGRPSVLAARTVRDGDRMRTFIGGNSVLVAEGQLVLD